MNGLFDIPKDRDDAAHPARVAMLVASFMQREAV